MHHSHRPRSSIENHEDMLEEGGDLITEVDDEEAYAETFLERE